MVLPFTHHWIVRFIASVVGFLGAVVAVNQNFMGWVKISKGTFAFNEALYIDPFLLSSGSLFIIIGQLWLILGKGKGTSLSADTTVTLTRGSKGPKTASFGTETSVFLTSYPPKRLLALQKSCSCHIRDRLAY